MKVMKRQFRRICSILLAAVLIVTSVPGMETTAFAAQDSADSEVVSALNYATDAGTADGVDEEEDSESEVTEYTMDFLFTVKGTAEEQAAVMEQVKVQSVDGTQDLGMSFPLTVQESISFHVEIPEGYTIISIGANRAKYYRVTKDYTNNNFTITDRMTGALGWEDVTVKVVIDKIQDKELYIEYPDTIESVEVLCGDTPVEIVNDKVLVSNTESVTLNVKPKANQLVTATYESENDTAPMEYAASFIEDGIYCYEIGRVVYNTSMLFTTDESADLTIDLGEGISGCIYEGDSDITLEDGLVITKKVGSGFRFSLGIDDSKFSDNNFVITNTLSDGTEENLQLIFDEYNWEYYCSYEVTQDATISLKWVPKTSYEVTFNAENATVYQFTYDFDCDEYYLGQECNENTNLSAYAGNSVLFGISCDSLYGLEYVSPTGNAEDGLQRVTTYSIDGQTYYIYRYYPTSDTEIQVKTKKRAAYEITLDLENVTAYSAYYDGEDCGISDVWEDKTVYEGESVIFAIQYSSDYKLEYVSPTDSKENALSYIALCDNGDDELYYIYSYKPTADTTIYVKAVQKEIYTLTFDLDSPYVYMGGYNFETDSEISQYELYEGNYSFCISAEENLKIESVVGTGDVSENDVGELDRTYDVEMDEYYYVVPLIGNMTVTVTSAEKEQYEVQINGENTTVDSVSGSIDNVDNVYTVYEGGNISFQVTPDEGYTLERVNVGGESAQTLYPVSKENTNTYAVKVDKDMVIDITTVEKTAYMVTFETTNAVATSSNPTDEEGNYVGYAEEAFTFTVEAEEGYVVEEVVCNEEQLQPVYNPQTATCYYEVIPEGNITISVTANIAEENQICFAYDGLDPDTISVWSESGQNYTPSAGYVTVPSNEIIWFDVAEDASTIAGVTSTATNGDAKTIYRTIHNGQEGYCLGNILDDTQVDITVGDTCGVTFISYYVKENEPIAGIVPVEGVGTFPSTVYVALEDNFKFRIIPKDDYGLKTVKVINKKVVSGSLETGIYELEPITKVNYPGLMSNVMISSYKKQNIEYTFDYPEEEASVSVYVEEEEVPLVNDAVVLPNAKSLTIKVKPLVNKLIDLRGSYALVDPEIVESDGTQVYDIGFDEIGSITDGHFGVYTYEYNTVDFQMENVSLLLGQYNEDGYLEWEEAETTAKVKKNTQLNMRFSPAWGYTIKDISVADETAGTITKQHYYNEEEGISYDYYTFIPKKDVTVNISTEVVPQNTYNFSYDSSMVDVYLGEYSYYYDEWDYEIEWTEGITEYKKYASDSYDVMFRVVPKEGYTISLVSTTEDRSGSVGSQYDDNYGISYYTLANSGDATITIVAEPIASYEISYAGNEGIMQLNLYNSQGFRSMASGSTSFSNSEPVYIWPQMEYTDDDEYTKYIITSVKANDEELVKTYLEDEDVWGYVLSYFNQDTTIVIETKVNEAIVNTTTLATDGDNSYKVFRYVESENEDGETVTSKVYVESGKKLYTSGRTDSFGIELEEGDIPFKVEFSRNGKTQIITPDEDGLYTISYPLSRGLKGTLTVYTEGNGDVSDNEGGDVSDNEGGDVSDNEGSDVSDNEEVTVIENIAITGITDGKVSLAIDSTKEFKLAVNPADIDLSRIGVEVIAAEGQPTDVVKAEIVEDNLRLTIAAVAAGENVATVKLYDITAKEKTYIPGGAFTVSTLSPTALTNGEVQIEINKLYDVAFTLGLYAPEGLSELLNGKYYYKVVVTPQGKDIPEEIKKATEKPQYFEKGTEDYQEIRVFVNTNDFGGGQAWTYDVKVTLVQADGNGVPDGTTGTKALYESKEASLTNIKTLNPYFSEKVTFYGLEKQIYTAQKEVAVAQFALDEGTSYPDIEKVEDITELNGKGAALEVWEEDSYIFVNVPSDAMIGKHTIEVIVGGPASMNKTTGTYVVNVVKGIENMQISVPSVSVYKKANKAATIKAAVTYNQDTTAPKSKKATWEVVKANGEAFTQGDALYGMLTVKNGKVTVNKSFVPSETESDNQFRVKATAADYEANKVYALSDVITLTSKPAEIGAVYVVAPADGGYQVMVKEGSTITTDKLDNAFVAVLKKDAEEKDFYTAEELNNLMLSSEILTYKSSNKAVTVKKADKVTLNATKAAKNVKLTVTTNDGGKKKAVMKFSVAYHTPEALALEVLNGNQALGAAGTKEVSFAGTTNTRLYVKVKEKSGETWTDLKALSNYKLSVKNGKIVASDNENGIYEVIVTAKAATVTLNNKTTGAAAKDAYVITNTAYSEAKAPKAKTKEKLIAGVMADRSVTYTLSGAYDYKNKYVLVETDYISRSKKAEAYGQFEAAASNLNTLVPITSDGKFTLTFNENQIPAGSYKLKLTFGTGSDVNNFIADAKPATVTLKAAKPKVIKGSYKPATSYKMEAKAGTSVALTGKGKNVVENSLVYYDLKNANIKGKQNEFLSYFELKDNTLCLKSELTDADIAYLKSKDGKNDLTGYVTYTVAYGNDGYGNPTTVTKTVKLTIKLK